MLISICVPCKNRADDLRKVMPSWIKAANESPPVEIAVLNYNSNDDLDNLISKMRRLDFEKGNFITYVKDKTNDYYHNARACNLCIMISSGEYFLRIGCDAFIGKGFIKYIREKISKNGYVWIGREKRFRGIIICQRKEFIEIGGYDERFEFYGSEDVDLYRRLVRRNKKNSSYPESFIRPIPTPKAKKFKNYRLSLSRSKHRKHGRKILNENDSNNVIIVNKGIKWGVLNCGS